jgi:cytochrome b561
MRLELSNERFGHSLDGANHRAQVTSVQWAVAALVVEVGVLGLVQHSWIRQALEVWINIHVLFGVLLWSLVIAVFHSHVKHSPNEPPIDARKLSRHLSRVVYLLLYVVIGVRQIIGLVNCIWQGGAFDFNLFDERLRSGAYHGGFDPKDDFHVFLAFGLSALVLARVLALRIWVRSVERAATLRAMDRVPH